MTTEDKIEHLKDWLDFYVFCKVSNIQCRYMVMDLFKETGNLIYKLPIEPVPFEMYLQTAQLIENKQNKTPIANMKKDL